MSLDYLNPGKYWVGDRCYRVLTHQPDQALGAYVEEDEHSDDGAGVAAAEDMDSTDCHIQQHANGSFSTAWHVPQAYLSVLIGRQGAARKRLERETGCRVTVPGRGEDGDVGVSGRSVAAVRTARLRMTLSVAEARRRHRPTHFLSLPLGEPTASAYEQFRRRVLEGHLGARGVEEGLMQLAPLLHLTLSVAPLVEEEELRQAEAAVREALRESGGPLRMRVRGLAHFTDEPPTHVRVVYAKAEDADGRTQRTADAVHAALVRTGLAKPTSSPHVKLHMTVMNARWLASRGDREADREATFDASSVLQEFADFDFGEVEVSEVQLNEMERDPETGDYINVVTVRL